MSKEDFSKYTFDSLVRIETKLDAFSEKFVTKKESNVKTLVLVLLVLLINGIILPHDLLSVLSLG